MTRPLSAAAVAAALLLAGAAGCRPEPLPEAELRARLAAQAAERGQFKSLTAAYDLAISGRKPDGSRTGLRCSGRMVAAVGGGLRMRGAKALGMAKIFDLLVSGDAYRLDFTHGKKFYTGSVSAALKRRGAERLAGTGRPDLTALLFPVPPMDGPEAPELAVDRREATLTWRHSPEGAARVLFVDAGTARPLRTEILDATGRRLAVIYYLAPAESGGLHPAGGFRVRGAGPTAFRLDINLDDVKVNGPVNEAAFRLEPAAGVEVIDVDAREAAKAAAAAAGPGGAK